MSVSLVRSEGAGPYLISFIEDISERLADQLGRLGEPADGTSRHYLARVRAGAKLMCDLTDAHAVAGAFCFTLGERAPLTR